MIEGVACPQRSRRVDWHQSRKPGVEGTELYLKRMASELKCKGMCCRKDFGVHCMSSAGAGNRTPCRTEQGLQ